MKTTWRGLAVAALAGAAAVGIACSGSTSASPPASACDHYYEVVFAGSCNGLPPPASEISRIRARFEKACTALLALPGISVTANALDSCADAVAASGGCSALDSAACTFGPGSLAGGASCLSDDQCQNSDCTAGSLVVDGGTQACGQCATGPNCGGATCGPNTTCQISGPSSDGGPIGMCLPVTFGEAGAKCDGVQTRCKAGLTCNRAVGTCSAPGGAGAPCGDTADCSGSLVCPVPPGSSTSTCQNAGQTGARCNEDIDCAAGLGCDFTTRTCATITWVAAGQPCNETARCVVGSCPSALNGVQSGTCPTVIPDGQPCRSGDPTTTCDTLADCFGGVCVLAGTSQCP